MGKSYEILIKKLNLFIKEYYKNLVVRGAIYVLIIMFSMLIVISVTEHFNFFNETIRRFLFWGYCIVVGGATIKYVLIPVIKMLQLARSLTHEEAAKIIGRHFEEISDKLINVLELNKIDSGSEAIIHASINQKIKEIEFTPFNRAINWSLTRSHAKYLSIPIVLILFVFLSGNNQILSESTFRIINYNTPFSKPPPFYFELDSDSLVVVENSDLSIIVSVIGEETPKSVSVNYNNSSKKMLRLSNTKFSYTFENIQQKLTFHLYGNDEHSKDYSIDVFERPEIEIIEAHVFPPKHTGINSQVISNSGSISVPDGSNIVWKIKALKTDTLKFILNNEESVITNEQNSNYFNIEKIINSNSKYSVSLANNNVSFIDTTFYDIKIMQDAFPFISTNNKADDTEQLPIISGLIRDDYGFQDLTAFTRIYGLSRDTMVKTVIKINQDITSQAFLCPPINPELELQPGESIDYYFIVRDNDKPNGYKASQSATITQTTQTYDQIQEAHDETNQIIKNNIAVEMSILKNLETELIDFEKELIKKDSLDWRDKKKLEDILEKQSNFQQKIEQLKNLAKDNFNKLNSTSLPSEEILKKQKELEDLFEKIIPEEMKELYEELAKLKDTLEKNELHQKIQDLQLSNEDLEKELDRNLEVLKQIEFEQKLEIIIDRIEVIKRSQIMLSENTKTPIEAKIKSQKLDNDEFKKIEKEIKEIRDLNQELENKQRIPETIELETKITNQLKLSLSSLDKGNKKRASKSQQKTKEELEKLSQLFTSMKKENQKEQQQEDMDVLRQILENLVYFSIEEESIFLAFESLDKNDPKYVKLMHAQQSLRDASKIIEDSLFALSKRVPQISSKINREINAINQKASSTIDHLRERLTMKAVQDQQFIMTSANNLALLLSQILEEMQKDAANDMPSSQQCEKPGKGSPKPGELKKMQEQLSKHLEELKKQIEKGEQNNMQQEGLSKQLVEMLAKQELIRQSLEELKNKMPNSETLQSLQEAIKDMKQTEEDIANKQLTQESLYRQKQILTRLLEVENAMREQGEDEKRESKTAITEYERIIQDAYEKYELEKLKETEILKTTPPSLNQYYKEKVNRYFNLIIK